MQLGHGSTVGTMYQALVAFLLAVRGTKFTRAEKPDPMGDEDTAFDNDTTRSTLLAQP